MFHLQFSSLHFYKDIWFRGELLFFSWWLIHLQSLLVWCTTCCFSNCAANFRRVSSCCKTRWTVETKSTSQHKTCFFFSKQKVGGFFFCHIHIFSNWVSRLPISFFFLFIKNRKNTKHILQKNCITRFKKQTWSVLSILYANAVAKELFDVLFWRISSALRFSLSSTKSYCPVFCHFSFSYCCF